ncbi:unnamed protein product [Soboliphyme baturini]|uniref:Protein aurora borealis n=1 Tax=Soboliphyme baturini TaxID=241478 RepID=A0A183J1J8_9BILA|nr:unnamed protein product [Soboliphyme baturini]
MPLTVLEKRLSSGTPLCFSPTVEENDCEVNLPLSEDTIYHQDEEVAGERLPSKQSKSNHNVISSSAEVGKDHAKQVSKVVQVSLLDSTDSKPLDNGNQRPAYDVLVKLDETYNGLEQLFASSSPLIGTPNRHSPAKIFKNIIPKMEDTSNDIYDSAIRSNQWVTAPCFLRETVEESEEKTDTLNESTSESIETIDLVSDSDTTETELEKEQEISESSPAVEVDTATSLAETSNTLPSSRTQTSYKNGDTESDIVFCVTQLIDMVIMNISDDNEMFENEEADVVEKTAANEAFYSETVASLKSVISPNAEEHHSDETAEVKFKRYDKKFTSRKRFTHCGDGQLVIIDADVAASEH